MAKKQSKLAWTAVCATVIGLVLYIISGILFPSKSTLTFPVFAFSACALVFLAIAAYAAKTLPGLLRDICLVAGGLCVIGAISFFCLGRMDPAADIWFIPVNYPAAEAASLYVSCAGLAFYFIAFLATLLKAFTAKD